MILKYFETDTHTGIHKPNHVEIYIIQSDTGQTHKYDECLIDTVCINAYDRDNKYVIGYSQNKIEIRRLWLITVLDMITHLFSHVV